MSSLYGQTAARDLYPRPLSSMAFSRVTILAICLGLLSVAQAQSITCPVEMKTAYVATFGKGSQVYVEIPIANENIDKIGQPSQIPKPSDKLPPTNITANSTTNTTLTTPDVDNVNATDSSIPVLSRVKRAFFRVFQERKLQEEEPTATELPSKNASTTEETQTNSTLSAETNSTDANSTSVVAPTNATNITKAEAPTSVAGQPRTVVCNEKFYQKWIDAGLKCGGQDLNVSLAVQAARCSLYNGVMAFGTLNFKTRACLQICKFPACIRQQWNYQMENGISSPIYRNLNFEELFGKKVIGSIVKATNGASGPLQNVTFSAKKSCPVDLSKITASNFRQCSCPASLPTQSSATENDDYASSQAGGEYVAPAAQGAAAVTVSTGVAATIISGTVSGGGAASAVGCASTLSGVSLAVTAFEYAQFTLLTGILTAGAEDTGALESFCKHFRGAIFMILPFGKAKEYENENHRRLMDTDFAKTKGIDRFIEIAGIDKEFFFYLTLAGIALFVALIFFFYFMALLIVALCGKAVKEYAVAWWDRVIGLLVLLAILSQFAIGMAATFQIQLSIDNKRLDLKLILAVCALVFLAFGIIFLGVLVVRKNERELRDVGTYDHTQKKINKRYGSLYEEYTFDRRFFFVPKMGLALITGISTGLVFMGLQVKISVMLALYIMFLFYLEIQQPYHSQFLQSTASLLTIMKIAVLVLTFFLVSSFSFFPKGVHKVLSFVIIAIQLAVFICLMIRQLYIIWKRYHGAKVHKKRLSEQKLDEERRASQEAGHLQPISGIRSTNGNYHHYYEDDYNRYTEESGYSEHQPNATAAYATSYYTNDQYYDDGEWDSPRRTADIYYSDSDYSDDDSIVEHQHQTYHRSESQSRRGSRHSDRKRGSRGSKGRHSGSRRSGSRSRRH